MGRSALSARFSSTSTRRRGANARPSWAALGALTALVLPHAARADGAGPSDAGTVEPLASPPPVSPPTSDPSSAGPDAAVTPPASGDASAAPGSSEAACPGERFVLLSFAPEVDEVFAGEVRTDLAAEIAPRGLSVCTPGSTSREAAAEVRVRGAETGVAIELDDRLTHKRVARDLSLSGIPANGRALAAAIAVDELLRASWAELTLQRATQPESPPPAAPRVDATPPSSRKPRVVRRRPRTRTALGGQAGYTRAGTDHDALALQLRASLHVSHAWVALSGGPQLVLPRSTQRGDIGAYGATGALTLGACSASGARMFACGGARGGLDWLRFRGRGAEGRRVDATLAHVSGVALVAGRLTADLYLFGEVALGALVRGARITDGRSALGEIGGMLLSLQLGLGFEL